MAKSQFFWDYHQKKNPVSGRAMVRDITMHFDALFVNFDKLIRPHPGPLWGGRPLPELKNTIYIFIFDGRKRCTSCPKENIYFYRRCSLIMLTLSGTAFAHCSGVAARWILQSFKCKLGFDHQQYSSVSKTEKPSKNPTNGRILLKSSNYGRARSQITMVNFFARALPW